MRILIVITAIAFSTCCSHAFAVDTGGVLSAFETATRSVTTYDVIVDTLSTPKARVVEKGMKRQGGKMRPAVEWEQLPPGSEMPSTTYRSRQVFSSDGRRRYESLVGATQENAKVFTGELTREYSEGRNTGIIARNGPEQRPYPWACENYSSLFHRTFLGGDLVDLIRQRDKDKVSIIESVDFPGKIEIKVSTQDTASMYPSFAFRIVLDPSHGMMPSKIDSYRGDFATRAYSAEITQFHKLSDGTWVPIEAEIVEGAEDFPMHVSALKVDVEKSKWNFPPNETDFTLSFPAGTHVIDEVSNTAYIAGSGDPGTTVDTLVKNATELLPKQRQDEFTSEWSLSPRMLLILANVIVIATVIIVVTIKRFR